MHTAIEQICLSELQARHAAVRTHLHTIAPKATGLLVFSRVDIYYLTGTFANGILWLPQGDCGPDARGSSIAEPVLLVRKGQERCRMESPLPHIVPYKSYGDLQALCAACLSPLNGCVAAQMSALPWSMASMLQSRLPECSFVAGDQALVLARATKSPWEISKMRLAGARHHQALVEDLPPLLHAGMSERDISHTAWQVFFRHGHGGMNRMGNYGESIFLGHVAVGDNCNYPSHFNGPLGLKGEHPSLPFMGYAGSVWQKNSLLALDIGFVLEGYHTDKTQIYWTGNPSSIPDLVRRAQEACMCIQREAAEALCVGGIPSRIWQRAQEHAAALGFSDGFMGLGDNKVQFLGHGIGLVVDEYPVVAARFDEPLQEGMVLALEPKIGLAGLGMVGVEDTFAVTAKGGQCITGQPMDIICID